MKKLPRTVNYPKLDANTRIFLRPNNFMDAQLTVSDYYNGATTYSFLNKTNVDGVSCAIRWSSIETSLGVYDWTFLDSLVNDAKNNFNKEIAFYLFTSAFLGTSSYVPAYIRADHVTYGGSVGHGGEVRNSALTNYLWVNWDNANLVARFQAFITALANRYKGQIAYLYLDEFWTDVELAAATNFTGGATGIKDAQKAYYSHAYNAFEGSSTLVFCKFNYLRTASADELADTLEVNTWAKNNGMNFSQELASPYPYDWMYPKPVGATINSIGYITSNENIGLTYSSAQYRLENTDSASWVTVSDENALITMRNFARALNGAGSHGIIDMQIYDGMPRPEQPTWGTWWKKFGVLIENNYLRE